MSDKLRHWPHQDPRSPSCRERARECIAKQTRDFVDKGGEIRPIDSSQNAMALQPLKPTREENIKRKKRTDYLSTLARRKD